jgi:hypothetical protein
MFCAGWCRICMKDSFNLDSINPEFDVEESGNSKSIETARNEAHVRGNIEQKETEMKVQLPPMT